MIIIFNFTTAQMHYEQKCISYCNATISSVWLSAVNKEVTENKFWCMTE